jgi:phage anti-repressor protein
MTTAEVKNDQLPNNRLQIFKSNTNLKVFKPTNSKLILVASEMISKGLVKTSLEFAEKFMFTFDSKEPFPINIEVLIEMKVYDRKDNCKTKLNKNFILNTDFNVQKATPELSGVAKKGGSGLLKENIMLTVDCFKSMCMLANSEIGKQVKNYYLDLEKIFKEYILRDIQSLQKTIETVVNENLKIKSTYSHLAELNDKLRMKRNYHKFKKGNCLYIITDRWREKDYLKIGYTDNINTRLQTYRTSMPDVKIEFLLYVTENKVLEKCLTLRYASKLIQKNHEYVIDATVEQLVKSINSLTKYLSIEATEETKLSLYNEPYKIYNLVFLDQNGNVEDNTDSIVLASPAKPRTPMSLDFDSSDQENDNEPECNMETEPDSEPKHECNTETENDSEVHKCNICGTEYKMKGNLLNHMIKVHNIQKDVKDDGKTCPICKKVFRDSGKRNRHVRGVHEKSSKVTCTECDKDFSSNDALMNHINNVHKKITQSKCDQCGKVCSTVGNLKKHIEQMHDKTTSVSCDICHNIFMSQCNLTQHILKVHERKEKCNCQLCGQELLSLLGLEYHMRNIHKI